MTTFSLNIDNNQELIESFFPVVIPAIKLEGHYPNPEKLILALSEAEDKEDSALILELLQKDPVLIYRILTKYKLASFESLNIFLEQNSVMGDRLNYKSLSQHSLPLSEFFAGRTSALMNYGELLTASFIANELGQLFENKIEHAGQLVLLYGLTPYLMSLYRPGLYAKIKLQQNDGFEGLQFAMLHTMEQGIGAFVASYAEELRINKELVELATFLNNPPWARKRWGNIEKHKARTTCFASYMGLLISHEIFQRTGVQGLQSTLRALKRHSGIPQTQLEDVVGKIPHYLKHTCGLLDVPVIPLPEYVFWLDDKKTLKAENQDNQSLLPLFIQEIELALQEHSNKQVYALHEAVHATLNAILICLGFQRAAYFAFNTESNSLELESSIGIKLFDYEQTSYSIAEDKQSVPVQTTLQQKLVTKGSALFHDGWPFVSFPVIQNNQVQGIFYADKAKRPNSVEISVDEINLCNSLASAWKR